MRIFTDESCTKSNQGPFMLIGGIVCDVETAKDLRKEIAAFRTAKGLSPKFEFHFSEIDQNSKDLYKDYASLFFKFYEEKCEYTRGIEKGRRFRRACFEIALLEHSKIDHWKFSGGDPEIGFFRFYHTLLKHCCRKHYVGGRRFHITIDNITTSNRTLVPSLIKRLRDSCLPKYADPVHDVSRQDSKVEPLLQLSDVILGAVSFAWNRQDWTQSSKWKAKNEVANHVAKLYGKPLTKTTFPGASFNIWQVELEQ